MSFLIKKQYQRISGSIMSLSMSTSLLLMRSIFHIIKINVWSWEKIISDIYNCNPSLIDEPSLQIIHGNNLSLNEPRHDKTNKMSVRPAKTQISLGIRPVWSESSLCAQWVAKDPRFLHADSEDSDQTGRMPRLIWVFAGRTLTLLVLSRGSSYSDGIL